MEQGVGLGAVLRSRWSAWIVMAGVLSLTMAAPRAAFAAECSSDADCSGNSVCTQGSCVSLDDAPTTLTPAPAAEVPAAPPMDDAERKAQEERERRVHAEEQLNANRQATAAERARSQAEQERAAEEQRKRDEEIAHARRPMRMLGFGLLGGSAAAAIATAGFGASALSKADDLEQVCLSGECPRSAQGQYDGLKTAETLSTVSFVATLALAGAGIYFLVRSSSIYPPGYEGKQGRSRRSDFRLQVAGATGGLVGGTF